MDTEGTEKFVRRIASRMLNRKLYGSCSICDEPLNITWCAKCEEFNRGTCPICSMTRTGLFWCQYCEGLEYINKFNKWSSGNKANDKLLRETQEWIPYTQFTDIQFLGEGSFSIVESAIWLEGPRSVPNFQIKSTIRGPNRKIVLKTLKNSRNNSDELVKELKIFHTYKNHWMVEIYGISQHPETGDYIIVMAFYENGNLSLQYKTKLTWEEIHIILVGIVIGLKTLHNAGFVHRYLHPGNIFPTVIENVVYPILDIGFSIDFNETSTSSKMNGVIPYVAPEVFLKNSYTKESDIYSLGVIMSDIVSGQPAFADRKHDLELILEICKGKRPEIPQKIPRMYVELVNQCLNAEPSKRPSLEEIITEKLNSWLNGGTITKEFDDIQINTEPLKHHSGAIYIRRKFPSLPEHYTHTFNNSIVIGKISKGHWKQKLTTLSNRLYAKLKSSKTSKLSKNSAQKLIENFVDCENKVIYNFIKENHLEWIPYSSFEEIKNIGNGGFATVYCAIWNSEKVALKQMHIPEDAVNNMINERPKIREINELLDHWNHILNYGPKYPEYKPGGYASLRDRFYNNEKRRIIENKFSDYGPEFKNYRIPDPNFLGDKNA
ncbi:43419_t:CDS:2, partial [Gigaspora margarita]